MGFKSKIAVSLLTAAVAVTTTISPVSVFAKAVPQTRLQSSKISALSTYKRSLQNSPRNLIESNLKTKHDVRLKSKTSKSPATLAASNNNALPLNPNGQESGTINTSGASVKYETVASQNSDYEATLVFTDNNNNQIDENCSLEIDVVDTATNKIIQSSVSNLINSYQQARVRASAGNTVNFNIKYQGTDVPNFNYTLYNYNITNVKDVNEPNDNPIVALNSTAQPLNKDINADFDNPNDVDCYLAEFTSYSALQINFTSSNGSVSDIGTTVYELQNDGSLSRVANGTGGITKFEVDSNIKYIIEVYSNSSSDYDYTMSLSNSAATTSSIPYSHSSSGYPVIDPNRTLPANMNIYDTYAKLPLDKYDKDIGAFQCASSSIAPVSLNYASMDYSAGKEGYLQSMNDVHLYQAAMIPNACITVAVDNLTTGIAIFAQDGTLLYNNANLTSKEAINPHTDSSMLTSVSSGIIGNRTYYQFKNRNSYPGYMAYVYLFPKTINGSFSNAKLPSYYGIWSGDPVYALSYAYYRTDTTSIISYPTTSSKISTVDFSKDWMNHYLPDHAYLDKLHFIADTQDAGLVANVTAMYKLATQDYWTKTDKSKDFTDTFYITHSIPLHSTLNFMYQVNWWNNEPKFTNYMFGYWVKVDYVYELGTCNEPSLTNPDLTYPVIY